MASLSRFAGSRPALRSRTPMVFDYVVMGPNLLICENLIFAAMNYQLLKRFRQVAVLEGISYLLLLFIAMPLKYMADMPEAVKYIGWAHGVLFVLYALLLVQCWQNYRWSFSKAAFIFVASLLPFAPFVVDRKLKMQEKAAV